MGKFYRFNNAVEHVHKPEDVRLDYSMCFWTADSINNNPPIKLAIDPLLEIPWLDTFMYCWVDYSIKDWNKNA